MAQLGPFVLDDELGRGGMARVWRARLPDRDAEVALKVVDAERFRDAEIGALFEREIQAAASLDHPHVIQVLDSGLVRPNEADRARGLVAGAPWLAMEIASGGSLADHAGTAPFATVRGWLGAILQALAHAHARGVLHRDLKPANILISGPADPRQGIKLSDFGIARVGSDQGWSSEGRGLVGTPLYMAPELFEADPNEYGPWTDLYALGCVAHQLIGGRPPFAAPNVLALIQAHVVHAPPRLAGRPDLPPGFQAWVDRLLAKRPEERFQTASDALDALDGVDGPGHAAPPLVISARRPTRAQETSGAQRLRLLGVGLGLVGVRPVPIVGRVREQDALWAAFAAATKEGEPRAVMLSGRAGMGRSRLAGWIGEQAAELGATVLRASLLDEEAAGDGVRRMLREHLRVHRLDGAALTERIARRLRALGDPHPWEAESLASLIAPTEEADGGVALGSRQERWTVLCDAVRRLAAHRPVVLILDDLDASLDAVGLLGWLLEMDPAGQPLPLLIVGTVSDSRRAAHAEAWAALYPLAQHDRLDIHPLGPLDARARRELVGGLLGLEPGLARDVAARSGGSPFFAIQLVSDQVRRGLLIPGPRGFRLADPKTSSLPENVHSLWSERVEHALADLGEDARRAAEALAVLGVVVEHDEWVEVCEALGVAADPEVLRALIRHQLVRSRGGTWELAHSLLIESLLLTARGAGRLLPLHSATAQVLARRIPSRDPIHALRVGRHLLHAGRPAEAFQLTIRVPNRPAMTASSVEQLDRLVALAGAALEALAPEQDDSRHGEHMLARLRVANGQDHRDVAEKLARTIVTRAERLTKGMRPPRAAAPEGIGDPRRWWGLRAEALRNAATAAREGGDLDRAQALFAESERAFDALGDDEGLGWCALGASYCHRYRGDLARSEALLRRALEQFNFADEPMGAAKALEGLGDTLRRRGEHAGAQRAFTKALALSERSGSARAVAKCLQGIGHLLLDQGRVEEAVPHLERSRQYFERSAAHAHLAQTLNTLGEAHRTRGDLEAAEREYRASLQIFERTRSAWSFMPRANLALVLLARHQYVEARATIAATRLDVAAQGRATYVLAMDVLDLSCLAAQADWPAIDAALPSLEERLGEATQFDRDVGVALASAARAADAGGHRAIAMRCWPLAARQFAGLHDEASLAEATAALSAR